jgi:hypothetical protein
VEEVMMKNKKGRSTTQLILKRRAVAWARKRLAQLLAQRHKSEPVWPVNSARNQVIVEAERLFNIGCAREIQRVLKIQRTEETEAQIAAWENGDTE